MLPRDDLLVLEAAVADEAEVRVGDGGGEEEGRGEEEGIWDRDAGVYEADERLGGLPSVGGPKRRGVRVRKGTRQNSQTLCHSVYSC